MKNHNNTIQLAKLDSIDLAEVRVGLMNEIRDRVSAVKYTKEVLESMEQEGKMSFDLLTGRQENQI